MFFASRTTCCLVIATVLAAPQAGSAQSYCDSPSPASFDTRTFSAANGQGRTFGARYRAEKYAANQVAEDVAPEAATPEPGSGADIGNGLLTALEIAVAVAGVAAAVHTSQSVNDAPKKVTTYNRYNSEIACGSNDNCRR